MVDSHKVPSLEGTDTDPETLSDKSRQLIVDINYIDQRLAEIENNKALLQRAKNSYLESLKQEILTKKTGMFFGD